MCQDLQIDVRYTYELFGWHAIALFQVFSFNLCVLYKTLNIMPFLQCDIFIE